ncbi:MAG: PEGA domain-containing protein [Terriglobales bacterium]
MTTWPLMLGSPVVIDGPEVRMKGFFCFCFGTLFIASISLAQTSNAQASGTPADSQQTAPAPPQQTADTSNFTSAKGFVLEDATPVKLRLNRTVSSGDAKVGDTLDFEVLQDISVNNTLVIPKGGLAYATVTEAQSKRRMGRAGKLDINIDYVKLVTGDKAALRAVKEVQGGSHTVGMTAGIVATSLVFFPAAPFFLFMHGKDISIPKGTEITAYVNGDLKLDVAKFQPAGPPTSPSVASRDQNVSSTSAKLQIESSPPGADIEVDGGFVGNTPSDIQVAEGDHTVVVKKSGFKDWQRKLKSSAGSSVHLSAELDKADTP